MKVITILFTISISGLILQACGEDTSGSETVVTEVTESTSSVSFTEVSSIITSNCYTGCHDSNSSGGISFGSEALDEALFNSYAQRNKARLEANTMPPSGWTASDEDKIDLQSYLNGL